MPFPFSSLRFLFVGLFLFICSAIVTAESSTTERFNPLFPRSLQQSVAAEMALRSEYPSILHYTVPTEKEAKKQENSFFEALPRTVSNQLQSVLLNNDIISVYGKPGAYTMGLLGQHSLDKIEPVMDEFIRVYDDANGARGIIPSFYIIYGTCWPKGDIGLLAEKVTKEYIEYAALRGWYVFLDHQIGRFTVEEAMEKLLPWLVYPNVHLALDPEWRTEKPMEEIGSVTSLELNTAQQMMQDYLIKNNLPGRRMLVVHQFKPKMILNREQVRSDFELVQIIHCADGFGSPALKKYAYNFNAQAENMPLKSFKLFLKPTVAGAGWDDPLMSPREVFSLNPRPYLIMYQ